MSKGLAFSELTGCLAQCRDSEEVFNGKACPKSYDVRVNRPQPRKEIKKWEDTDKKCNLAYSLGKTLAKGLDMLSVSCKKLNLGASALVFSFSAFEYILF